MYTDEVRTSHLLLITDVLGRSTKSYSVLVLLLSTLSVYRPYTDVLGILEGTKSYTVLVLLLSTLSL